jgi:chromosome segregation ATPase
MARVTGKDVVLDLMGEVKRLGEVQVRQEAAFARFEMRLELVIDHTRTLATQLDGLTQRVDGLAQRMDGLTQRMDELTQRMDELTQQMGAVTQQMNTITQQMNGVTQHLGVVTRAVADFSDESTSLRGDLTTLARTSGEMGAGLKRVAALLAKMVNTNDERFDDLEARVLELEKKSA